MLCLPSYTYHSGTSLCTTPGRNTGAKGVGIPQGRNTILTNVKSVCVPLPYGMGVDVGPIAE